MMKIPYAVRDFHALITEDYLYLDRTDRIPIMEDLGKELLFLRPRRFGKSLWLSTLMNYYDVAKADDFEQLFGHLAIGQNPTPLRNQYMVMRWDFSEVESYGTVEQIRLSLYDQINTEIAIFAEEYADLLKTPIQIHPDNALSSFKSAVAAVRRSRHKLYLFIDEYDNFANEVMMVPKELHKVEESIYRNRYWQLVSG
ncbi:MAG: AAA family ATPase [Chloroflexota bacterium]